MEFFRQAIGMEMIDNLVNIKLSLISFLFIELMVKSAVFNLNLDRANLSGSLNINLLKPNLIMECRNSHFWIGLGLGSIIGAITYRLAHSSEAEKLKDEVYNALQKLEEQAKEKVTTLANEHLKK